MLVKNNSCAILDEKGLPFVEVEQGTCPMSDKGRQAVKAIVLNPKWSETVKEFQLCMLFVTNECTISISQSGLNAAVNFPLLNKGVLVNL